MLDVGVAACSSISPAQDLCRGACRARVTQIVCSIVLLVCCAINTHPEQPAFIARVCAQTHSKQHTRRGTARAANWSAGSTYQASSPACSSTGAACTTGRTCTALTLCCSSAAAFWQTPTRSRSTCSTPPTGCRCACRDTCAVLLACRSWLRVCTPYGAMCRALHMALRWCMRVLGALAALESSEHSEPLNIAASLRTHNGCMISSMHAGHDASAELAAAGPF